MVKKDASGITKGWELLHLALPLVIQKSVCVVFELDAKDASYLHTFNF